MWVFYIRQTCTYFADRLLALRCEGMNEQVVVLEDSVGEDGERGGSTCTSSRDLGTENYVIN